jgi:DNA-binding transcriptional ArsR family regulator
VDAPIQTPHSGGAEAPNGSSQNIHRIFHALGDPTRQALVERLSEAPVTVSQLAEPFSMSLAAVMQHLQILEESGLVRTEKVGRVRTCRIEPKGFSVMEQWIRDRRTAWERRFDRLGEFLAETIAQPDE